MLKHGYMKRDREQPGGEEDFTKLPPSSSSSSHHTPLLPNNNSSGNSDDLLSMLPSQKKADMIALVNRLKSKQISMPEFMSSSHSLLGPQYYAIMIQKMQISSAAGVGGGNAASSFRPPQPATIPTPGSSSNVPSVPPLFSSSPSSSQQSQSYAHHQHHIQQQQQQQKYLMQQQQSRFHQIQQQQQQGRFIASVSMPSVSSATAAASYAKSSVSFDFSVQPTNQAPAMLNANANTKFDSNSFQDVLQSSGVNLQEETDHFIMMTSASNNNLKMGYSRSSAYAAVDIRSQYNWLLSPNPLRKLVTRMLTSSGLVKNTAMNEGSSSTGRRGNTNVELSEDFYSVLSHGVQARLSQLVESMIRMSKIRTDLGRSEYKIKIINDPRRQAWVLAKHLNDLENKPLVSIMEAKGEQSASATGSLSSQSSLSAPLVEHLKKPGKRGPKKSAAAQSALAVSGLRNREDITVKTKLANVSVASALGGPTYAWMTQGSSQPSSSTSSSQDQKISSSLLDKEESSSQISQGFSDFGMPPLPIQSSYERIVCLKDFLAAAENDKHLQHSVTMLKRSIL